MNQLAGNLTHVSGFAAHPGGGRAVNEDSAGLPDGVPQATLANKGYLYIVADGVGGHRAGNVASQMAVDLIRRAYYEDPDVDVVASLQRAIAVANGEIHRQAQSPAYEGMGATVVAAVVRGDELVVVNVGDSRAYLLRGSGLQQLTSDHTWVAERVASGLLSPKEAAHHDMRHVITRSLGAQPTVKVEVRSNRMLPGDRLLLCSDGVWEPVPEAEIPHLLGRRPPQAAAAALVNRAVTAGGGDDATALVVTAGSARTGILSQAVEAILESPGQRILVFGVGAVLIVALLICGVTRLPFWGSAQILPTLTSPVVVPARTPQAASSPTSSLTDAPQPTPTAFPTATSTMTPEPPVQPEPTSTPASDPAHCIQPVATGDTQGVYAWEKPPTNSRQKTPYLIPVNTKVIPVCKEGTPEFFITKTTVQGTFVLVRWPRENEEKELWIFFRRLGQLESGQCTERKSDRCQSPRQ